MLSMTSIDRGMFMKSMTMREVAEDAIKTGDLTAFKTCIATLKKEINDTNTDGFTLLHLIAGTPDYNSSRFISALVDACKKLDLDTKPLLNSLDRQGYSAYALCMKSSVDLAWRLSMMNNLLQLGANPFVGKRVPFTLTEMTNIRKTPQLNTLLTQIGLQLKQIEREQSPKSALSALTSMQSPRQTEEKEPGSNLNTSMLLT